MNKMDNRISVCVFCSSSDNLKSVYKLKTANLGTILAKEKIRMIYGGGNNGLMGVLSEQLFKNGGHITGVITEKLKDMGFAYDNVTEMIITKTMHERKAKMEELADAFITLPGGFGTLEETLEIMTLNQLGVISKPLVILNLNNFFDKLIEQIEKSIQENFITGDCRKYYYVTNDERDAVDYIIENSGIMR